MLQQTNTSGTIDVFISHKSADLKLAKQLYDYLVKCGLAVFEADETLPQLGNADYRKTIDDALDRCQHMVVVGSSVANIVSDWVEAEWGSFINEKRSGRKKGNILTVITANLKIEELPASLRGYEVLYFKQENFERIAAYLGKNYQDNRYKPPPKSILKSAWLWRSVAAACVVALAVAGIKAYIPEVNKPYNAALSVAPAASALPLNADYPPFNDGELSIHLDGQEMKKTVLAGQEIILGQLPASSKNKKVAVKLESSYWAAASDSILLTEKVYLPIVPNGKLEAVMGSVLNARGVPLEGCSITIDGDTTIHTNTDGIFKIKLPYRMQKRQNSLFIKKQGYNSYTLPEYNPGVAAAIILEKQ